MEELNLLNSWLIYRGSPSVDMRETAGIGYIAYEEIKGDDDRPVAVAFLRRCEGGFGMLDGLCTNPSAPSEVRHIAIDKVVEKVIDRAKKYGMKHLLSWSLDAGTLERSQRHGFVRPPYVLITRSL